MYDASLHFAGCFLIPLLLAVLMGDIYSPLNQEICST